MKTNVAESTITMSNGTPRFEMPPPMAAKVHRVQVRSARVGLAAAVVGSLAALVAVMMLAMAIDWAATLYDHGLRTLLTTTALGIAAMAGAMWAARAWRRGRSVVGAATAIDGGVPQLEERWSTVAELSAPDASPQTIHPAMYRHVAGEASRLDHHVDPQQVVQLGGLERAAWALGAATLVLLLVAVFDSQRVSVLLRRFWAPGADISATQLSDVTGHVVAAKGESVTLHASLAGAPVSTATLLLETPDELESIAITPHAGDPPVISHRLRAIESSARYRMRAGDGQTEWYDVIVAERPEIAAIRLRVTPPAYTGQETQQWNKLPARFSAVAGSRLELLVRPVAPIATGVVDVRGVDKQLLEQGGEGWYRWTTELTQSLAFSPVLTEPNGLENRRPPLCRATVYPDRPPTVRITSPNREIDVRPDDTIEVRFQAEDDFGVGSAELILYGEPPSPGDAPVTLAVIPIDLGEQVGESKVKASVPLELARFQPADGSALSYEVRVSEARGEVGDDALHATPGIDQPRTGSLAGASDPPEPKTDNVQSASPPTRQATPSGTPQASATQSNPAAKLTPQTSTAVANAGAPQPQANVSPADAAASSKSATAATNSTSSNSRDTQADAAAESATAASRASQPIPSAAPARGTEPPSEQVAAAATSRDDQSETKPGEQSGQSDRQSMNASNTAQSATPAADDPAEKVADSATSRAQPTAYGTPGGQQQSGSQRSPGDDMPRRTLDVAQNAASNRMNLRINKYAGSFDGQQRSKLEIAIAGRLAAIDAHLAETQERLVAVLDEMDAGAAWNAGHDRQLGEADQSLKSASEGVGELHARTRGTPYAFIGLQLTEIGLAHLNPGTQSLWQAQQSEGDGRTAAIRTSWQHLTRARGMLADLTRRFQQVKREQKLAAAVQEVERMYRVFVEDAMAMLQADRDGTSGHQRRIAEFDLDEEYLERLREVLQMRQKMLADLARILAEDPRLLRRFMDSFRNNADSLYVELTQLRQQQEMLNDDSSALADDPLARGVAAQLAEDAGQLARSAAELSDRFAVWMPLNREANSEELAAAKGHLDRAAVAAQSLEAAATALVPPAAVPEGAEPSRDPADGATRAQQYAAELRTALAAAQASLVRVPTGDDSDFSDFLLRRSVDGRQLMADLELWDRQRAAVAAGRPREAAALEQLQLAQRTDALAEKLGGIEQELAGLLLRPDGKVPASIAKQARRLLATLDRQAVPNQASAAFALRKGDDRLATLRGEGAAMALRAAEELLDALIAASIKELDKLPVQDPIASLLDDPTLDELLAQLERERDLAQQLGIPLRPSNLQIMGDMVSGGGGMAASLAGQMRAGQQQMRRAAERAERKARERIRDASRIARAARLEGAADSPASNWNRLVSDLEDGLLRGGEKLPPEEYRAAIEQYFELINRAARENRQKMPQ